MISPEDVFSLFPEIEWLNSNTLKESVVKTWVEATKLGGWNKDELEKLPFVLIELKDCSVTLVEHVRNVTKLAAKIEAMLASFYNKHLKVNREVVLAGALLHDVGKLVEYSQINNGYTFSQLGKLLRHPIIGAILAFQCGVPPEVCHIISVHSFEGDKSYISPEGFIVKNADWLNFDFLAYKYQSNLKH
ncbi:HD domain-containing protein [Acetomicrobium sp. UBA5826]|uniref:HD domain-containing protein n=1 Tax=Acetomicrobium sp. UBA5826 TaxID=1946039 RepID=UPI00258047FD|nr:HD domain-containing protein [Acetomicrobium sp. UBA5826]